MTVQTAGLTIRPFTRDDYAALAALVNQVYVDFLRTAEELEFDDRSRPEKLRCERWMAEREGRVVGMGEYDQSLHLYHPRKFNLEVLVDAQVQGQGIGEALYATVSDAVRRLDPLSAATWSREDMPDRLRFFTERGFVEDWRAWASELDLAGFDPAPYQHYVDEVLAQGVEITTLAALADDAELTRKVFDMGEDIERDIPRPPDAELQEVPYEEWIKGWERPNKLPEGYILAVTDGKLVGTSQLWRSPEPDMLRTGLTGTRRDYRRRGIAFALKLRALAFAREYGARRVVTDNASVNRPMLSINEAIGFVKKPAWIHLQKRF